MTVNINGTSGVSGVDGTAGTPALQGTDSNTGISFGADTVNINTGGTTRATVDSSGRVGIGTTSPTRALQVYDSSNAIISAKAGSAEGFINTTSTAVNFESSAGIPLTFSPAGSLKATLDTSGRLLVGTSSTLAGATDSLLQIRGNSSGSQFAGKVALATEVAAGSIVSGTDLGAIYFGNVANGIGGLIECKGDAQWGTNDYPGRLVFSVTSDGASSPTERMRIRSDGSVKFETANIQIGGGTGQNIFRTGADGSGLHFTTNGIVPTNENGTISDNTETWGNSGYRWSVIYAATGTINTSDANEKQDIQDLSAAELAVAKELKSLFKTFKWKNAVAEKGDNARIHVGVIAQDVQQLFADHGLDVTKYGLWCSDTWYEVDGIGVDSNGIPYKADSEGAVARTRLGIRYDELLAFVIAAL